MIALKRFIGGLGNQLFQIASTFGIARSNDTSPLYPYWRYQRYFKYNLPQGSIQAATIREVEFEYNPIHTSGHAAILGYFQSPKYWKDQECIISDILTFEHDFYARVKEKYDFLTEEYPETIAVHIRRGDYVNNPNYVELGLEYYIPALAQIPDIKKKAILIFSDDLQAAKAIGGDDSNVIYVWGGTDIEDLCMMTMCDYHIIANSSFSWWGAYLSYSKKIVRPKRHFAGDLAKRATTKDLYPENWIAI